jgi:hypothetical protein
MRSLQKKFCLLLIAEVVEIRKVEIYFEEDRRGGSKRLFMGVS